jgi:hypothetical protein
LTFLAQFEFNTPTKDEDAAVMRWRAGGKKTEGGYKKIPAEAISLPTIEAKYAYLKWREAKIRL